MAFSVVLFPFRRYGRLVGVRWPQTFSPGEVLLVAVDALRAAQVGEVRRCRPPPVRLPNDAFQVLLFRVRHQDGVLAFFVQMGFPITAVLPVATRLSAAGVGDEHLVP